MTVATFKMMQILCCCISIGLISHESLGLNVNRPSSRWARSDDSSDGWKASNGPYNSEPYPILRPAVTSVAPSVSLESPAPARKDDILAVQNLPLLTALSPEGFYELVVGKKSPLSGGESIGGGGSNSNTPTGSPDVIIGRVMSAGGGGGIESASTTTAASVTGYSHPAQQPAIPVKEKAEGERSEIRELLEMESRSPSVVTQESLIKKNDYSLPPGSFYLPAVSTKANQYYSDSEHSIYIPLRRQDQPSFPVRTRVVLVNNQQPPAPAPPPAAVYHSKEAVEQEEEEEEARGSIEEQEEEEEEEDNEEELDSVAGGSHRPTDEPPVRPAGPMDLVMTLYPNLPKLMASSHFTTHAIKNFLKLNKAPAPGSTSVIHEAKFVTPPQGYLPQLPSKPLPTAGVPVKPAKLNLVKPGNNLPLTQLSRSPGTKPVALHPNNFGAAYPSDQRHHPSTTSTIIGGTRSTIQFMPFTPDDISPLNFLLPPASSSSSTAEKVTATDQPDTRSAAAAAAKQNYYSALPPQSNGDLIADSNVHITHSPLKVVPAPKLDFSWNLFQPLPSEVSHQQTAGGDLPFFGLNENKQQQKTQPQHPQEQKPTTTKTEGQHLLLVPGETGEIVVRTKMATSGSDSGRDGDRPGLVDSADIITSYYHDNVADKSKYGTEIQQHTFFSSLPSKATENREDKEIATTTPSAVEEVATTTAASRNSYPGTVGSDKFPHRNDDSHQPELVANVPPSTKHEEDDVYSPLRLPDIADDQQVAGSQIHETTVYEENLPRVRHIKPQSLDLEGEGKSSTPFYKAGRMSPKGAMYTVTQGHSKVKFFGFNALHNGELKPIIDGKYLTYLQQQQQDQQLPQEQEPDWKFSPYLPVRLPASGIPAFKIVPKKSIPISPGKKSTIRPVFFAKRPNNNEGHLTDGSAGRNTAPWSPSIAVSDPFEYHAHLQKMAEDQGRLPASQSSSSA